MIAPAHISMPASADGPLREAFADSVLTLEQPSAEKLGGGQGGAWHVVLACFDDCALAVRWKLDALLASADLEDASPVELRALADMLSRHAERLRKAAKGE